MGDWVVMRGIVNSAMNGQVGLLERFDDESGRWLVDLAHAGCGNVLPAKLRRVMPGNEEAAEQKANGEQVVEQEGDGNAAEQKGGTGEKEAEQKGETGKADDEQQGQGKAASKQGGRADAKHDLSNLHTFYKLIKKAFTDSLSVEMTRHGKNNVWFLSAGYKESARWQGPARLAMHASVGMNGMNCVVALM